jgi:hypothetical protein
VTCWLGYPLLCWPEGAVYTRGCVRRRSLRGGCRTLLHPSRAVRMHQKLVTARGMKLVVVYFDSLRHSVTLSNPDNTGITVY